MRFPPDSSSAFFFIKAMQYLSTIKYGEGIKITIVQNLESKAMLAHCNLYVDTLHYQKLIFHLNLFKLVEFFTQIPSPLSEPGQKCDFRQGAIIAIKWEAVLQFLDGTKTIFHR